MCWMKNKIATEGLCSKSIALICHVRKLDVCQSFKFHDNWTLCVNYWRVRGCGDIFNVGNSIHCTEKSKQIISNLTFCSIRQMVLFENKYASIYDTQSHIICIKIRFRHFFCYCFNTSSFFSSHYRKIAINFGIWL